MADYATLLRDHVTLTCRRVNAENWHALRAVGESANKRLCDAQAADAQPAPDVVTSTR